MAGSTPSLPPQFVALTKRFWSFPIAYALSFGISKYAELGTVLTGFWTFVTNMAGTADGVAATVTQFQAINYTSLLLAGVFTWLFGMWKGQRPVTLSPKKAKEAKATMLKSPTFVMLAAFALLAAVVLGGCAETMEKRMGDVRTVVEQGKKVKKEAIEGMANQVPGYCGSVVTRSARAYIRGEVNAVLAARKDEWRINNLCIRVDRETGKPVGVD